MIVGANDHATDEHEHAIEGDMGVKTSGEMTGRLLGCMAEAPLVSGRASWLCTGIAHGRKQTFTAICRGGGRVAGA